MSRCKACDKKLSEFELTRKSVNTEEYIDLCNHCFSTIAEEVDCFERSDLYHEEECELEDGTTLEEYTVPCLCEEG